MPSLSLTDLTGFFPCPDPGYGVFGDGTRDDAPGINRIMTAAAAANGGNGGVVLMMPTPTGYRVTTDITVPTGVTLIIHQGVTLSGGGNILTTGTGAFLDFRGGFRLQGSVKLAGAVAGQQSSTAPALATGGTIATAGIGVARVAPAGAVTGVILQAGSSAGQQLVVVNESAGVNSVTFAAAGTSNVADGAGSALAGLTARGFAWDSVTSLWYRLA